MTDPIALDARTTRHSLPLLYPGQAQQEIFVNEALARLDATPLPVGIGGVDFRAWTVFAQRILVVL